MHFFYDYLMFFAKTFTLVGAFLITVAGIIALSVKQKVKESKVKLQDLSKFYRELKQKLTLASLSPKQAKKFLKQEKRANKQHKEHDSQSKLFVINFHGDIRAQESANLQQQINAILLCATSDDEVLVRIESPGGMAHAYGLAAAELARLRERKIPLTIAIDKVAASGGYMMACVADKIIASPFAIVGSIGAVAQMPNFHKFLKKHDIDFEMYTAGEYKRTVTIFGENTDKAREKFQQQLETLHHLFKSFVKNYRPQLDINQVATGEYWFGEDALSLKLVDELQTSENYILDNYERKKILLVKYHGKAKLMEKIMENCRSLLRSATEL